jgi:myosin heavy subunit
MQATPTSFVQKLNKNFKKMDAFSASRSGKAFTVHHYAGKVRALKWWISVCMIQ